MSSLFPIQKIEFTHCHCPCEHKISKKRAFDFPLLAPSLVVFAFKASQCLFHGSWLIVATISCGLLPLAAAASL